MRARCGSKSLHPIQKNLPSQHAVQIIVLSERKQHSTKKIDITFDPCVTVELEKQAHFAKKKQNKTPHVLCS